MHAMLAPDLLCRVLSDDPRLSRDTRFCRQKAQAISIPAARVTQLMQWQDAGRFTGDLVELNVDSYRRRTAMDNKRSRGRPATRATLMTSQPVSPRDNDSTDLPGSPGEAG